MIMNCISSVGFKSLFMEVRHLTFDLGTVQVPQECDDAVWSHLPVLSRGGQKLHEALTRARPWI